MSGTKEHIPLRVERMPDGGFVVSEAAMMDSPVYRGPLFASTSIGDALAYVASRLDPKATPATGVRCPRCLDPRCLPPHCYKPLKPSTAQGWAAQ